MAWHRTCHRLSGCCVLSPPPRPPPGSTPYFPLRFNGPPCHSGAGHLGQGLPSRGFSVFHFLNINARFCDWRRPLGIPSQGQEMFPRLYESFCVLTEVPARHSLSGWGRAGERGPQTMGRLPAEVRLGAPSGSLDRGLECWLRGHTRSEQGKDTTRI